MDNYVTELNGHIRVRGGTFSFVKLFWFVIKMLLALASIVYTCLLCCIMRMDSALQSCCSRNENPAINPYTQSMLQLRQRQHQQLVELIQRRRPDPVVAEQSWPLENHPNIREPNPPPYSTIESHIDLPPPYEKVCGT